MAIDTRKWLIEDMGFSEDEATALLPQFSGRAEKLEKGFLRQSDYSRQMNDFTAAKTALATANDKLTADMAEWAELTAAEKAQSGDLKAALDDSRLEITRLTQKVTRLAEDSGIDPKTILTTEVVAPVVKPVTAFDPAPLQQQIGGLANYMLTAMAKLPRIAREHKILTGEDFDEDTFIEGIKTDIAKNKTDNLDPVKRWEAQNNIPAKRTEKAAEQRAAERAADREEGRVAALSEAVLPNTRPAGQGGSPAFRTAGGTGQSKLQRPQPLDRLAGARAAVASGKYRNAGPGGAV